MFKYIKLDCRVAQSAPRNDGGVRQKGAALLTAVLIAAVVAILASTIISNQGQWIAQTALADRQDQFQLLAYRLQDWASTAVQMRQQQNDPTQLPAWPAFTKTMNQAQVSARLSDGNRLYNINWLIYPSMDASFARLLKMVQPTLDVQQALKIAQTITGMLQSASGIKPGSKQSVAAPQNRDNVPVIGPFHTVAQLAGIQGISADMMQKLAPLLVALPPSSGINILTGNQEVFQALLPPSNDYDTIWTAYMSCRLAFHDRHPVPKAWQACLQQNDGDNFIKNINAQEGQNTFGNSALLIYRSDIADFEGSIQQADLHSQIEATYWMAPTTTGELRVLGQHQLWHGSPLVALIAYWRS